MFIFNDVMVSTTLWIKGPGVQVAPQRVVVLQFTNVNHCQYPWNPMALVKHYYSHKQVNLYEFFWKFFSLKALWAYPFSIQHFLKRRWQAPYLPFFWTFVTQNHGQSTISMVNLKISLQLLDLLIHQCLLNDMVHNFSHDPFNLDLLKSKLCMTILL